MADRPKMRGQICQADADRLFKAAMRAGYNRAKFVSYPDGRIELIAEKGSGELSSPSIDIDHDTIIRSRLEADD